MKKIFLIFLFPILVLGQNKKAVKFFNAGKKALSNQNYNEAIESLTSAIDKYGEYYEAYNVRGNTKKHLKDYEGAKSDYTKAIEINPNDDTAYFNRAFVKDDLEDYEGAIADYTKAIEINPNYAVAYNNRGISKRILKQNYCTDFKKACDLGYCGSYNELCK